MIVRRRCPGGRQAPTPQVQRRRLALADAGMVALFPGLQRGHDAGDALLAHLHAAADAPVLQVGGAHEILAPGDDARGRAAQEFVAAVDDDVGALVEEAMQIVFRGGVDDDRARPSRGRSAQNSSSDIMPYCTEWCVTT